jgi:hypothetical protein
MWSRGQRIEKRWFPASKEVQDTQGFEQHSGVRLLVQEWNFYCSLPGKGYNNHRKVLHCTSRQTEAANGLETSRKAFENEYLFLDEHSAPHKVGLTHQKVADGIPIISGKYVP